MKLNSISLHHTLSLADWLLRNLDQLRAIHLTTNIGLALPFQFSHNRSSSWQTSVHITVQFMRISFPLDWRYLWPYLIGRGEVTGSPPPLSRNVGKHFFRTVNKISYSAAQTPSCGEGSLLSSQEPHPRSRPWSWALAFWVSLLPAPHLIFSPLRAEMLATALALFACYFLVVVAQQLQQCWATMMTSMLMMAVIEADETLHTSQIARHPHAGRRAQRRIKLLTSRCRCYWSRCALRWCDRLQVILSSRQNQ